MLGTLKPILRPVKRYVKKLKQKLDDRRDAMAYFRQHLARHLDFENGFFIELGANDGIRNSNTLGLEKTRGWHGLLIEPIPRLYEQAKKNRPNSIVVNCACVAFDYSDDTILITDIDLMSIVEGALPEADRLRHIKSGKRVQRIVDAPQITVPAHPLSSLLDAHHIKHVDFMSLDVEGYEIQVLKGLDLARHQPTYILIEVHLDKDNLIADYLHESYKFVTQIDEKNALYKSRSSRQPILSNRPTSQAEASSDQTGRSDPLPIALK